MLTTLMTMIQCHYEASFNKQHEMIVNDFCINPIDWHVPNEPVFW